MSAMLLKYTGVFALLIFGFTRHMYAQKDPVLQEKPALIFDLGGVLVGTHTTKAFLHLGISNILKFMIHGHQNPKNIRHSFYRLLDTIHGESGNPLCLKDEEGTEMPYLMYEWLIGIKRPTQLRVIICQAIENHPEWFTYPAEQELMIKMAHLMFNPQTFIETRTLYKDSYKLIKKCKKAGYPLYVLSNWDEDSFSLMRKKYAFLFDLFDGIVISGQVKTAKPAHSIFEYCKSIVKSPYMVFIDDQHENIMAARQAGLFTIHCPRKSKNNNHPDIKRTLRKINTMTTLIYHTYIRAAI